MRRRSWLVALSAFFVLGRAGPALADEHDEHEHEHGGYGYGYGYHDHDHERGEHEEHEEHERREQYEHSYRRAPYFPWGGGPSDWRGRRYYDTGPNSYGGYYYNPPPPPPPRWYYGP